MNDQLTSQRWAEFQATNRFRRAIRNFEARMIPEEDVRAVLGEAVFAPSSGNLQPYQFHWVRSPQVKAEVATACNGQKAASSAADLVVVVASPEIAKRTAQAQLSYVERSPAFELKSKAYHRKQAGKFLKILGIGGSPVWSPVLAIAALIRPALSLLPVGHIGSRHWAARNAAFAAHTLMLAAAARGIDCCPMEGFSASKVAKVLDLPRGTVIPLIIALGYRADDARIEERWRRPMDDVVVTH